jgi:MFS family permease
MEWMALNITAYAIASFSFSILAGPIIDKLSAKKVFPFILFPMVIGLIFLIVFKHPFATTLFWFFLGITAGLNPTVSNALYAEEYGIQGLGAVRSLFTFVMVGSTALGPIMYSLMLDNGFSFNLIHIILILVIALNIFVLMFRNKISKRLIAK